MKLKKALFAMTLFHLSVAALLSVFFFWVCLRINSGISSQSVELRMNSGAFLVEERGNHASPQMTAASEILSVLQIVLPVTFFVAAMLATASQFYRLKLKEPLELLIRGANRIMDRDLDFVMEAKGEDELGQLCSAFETMRRSLLENNRQLWQQAEERKRLNAAFSHDLRNPVTVLKGSAKMAREWAEKMDVKRDMEAEGSREKEQLLENLARIEDYTGRIQRYVEVMGNVGRLEEVTAETVMVSWDILTAELESAVRLLAPGDGKELLFSSAGDGALLLDKSMLFQIAENLVSNAMRFARRQISVRLSLTGDELWLEVTDDGAGFPEELLKNGVRPFQKGQEESGHFGMGLYICSLLCQKHGGRLKIQNCQSGAQVCAILRIS